MSVAFKGKNLAHPDYENLGFEAIWQSIRALKTFSRTDLVLDVAKRSSWSVNDWTVKSYIQRLEKAGYLKVIRTDETGKYIYQLETDCGAEAPRLRKDGTRCSQGRKQENLWRSMRMLKDFTHKELAITASADGVSISEQTVKDFIKDLRTAGYIRTTSAGCKATGLASYRLVQDTGPKPPAIRRINQVYDRNLKKIVWPAEEESA